METVNVVLGKVAANQCLGFVKEMIVAKATCPECDEDMKAQVESDLNGLKDFLEITTRSELEEVTIPERYNRIYTCVEFAAVIYSVGPLASVIMSEMKKMLKKDTDN